MLYVIFFFFQAEDGIRDRTVTGVQTCALPISWDRIARPAKSFTKQQLLPRMKFFADDSGSCGAKTEDAGTCCGTGRWSSSLQCESRTHGAGSQDSWCGSIPVSGASDRARN